MPKGTIKKLGPSMQMVPGKVLKKSKNLPSLKPMPAYRLVTSDRAALAELIKRVSEKPTHIYIGGKPTISEGIFVAE